MPKRILVSQRSKFWALYRAGHTIKEASKRSGFSESYGKGLVRNGIGPGGSTDNRNPVDVAREVEEEEAKRPKRYDELSEKAKRGWDDFAYFRRRYLGSVSVPWQDEAAALITEALAAPEKKYLVVNCPQGAGKTRFFSHDLPAWLTVRDRSIRGILGSHGLNVAKGLTKNLRDTFERTVPALARDYDKERGLAIDAEATLSDDFGRFKPMGSGNTWKEDGFVVEQHGGKSMEKEPTWAAFSRDAKFLGWRVDFMVWDDLVTSDMLRNFDGVLDLYRWYDDEAQSRLDPGGLCLLVGQRLRSNDIYRYALDKRIVVDEFDESEDAETRPMYGHIIYKAHYSDRCDGKKESHRPDAASYPESCMLDPARIKWRDILEKKADGNYEVVYQQEDVDPSSVLIRESWVDGGVCPVDGAHYPGCYDDTRSIGDLPPVLTPGAIRYITVDPSPTKFWAVEDWVYTPLPHDPEVIGYRHLVDVSRVRMGVDQLLDWSNDHQSWTGLLDEWVLRAKDQGLPVGTLIFEKNAAQRWAMQYEHFRRWQSARGVQVIPHETMGNKADTNLGVEALLPAAYKHGRVRLPAKTRTDKKAVHVLVREVTTWPNATTDDCVMAQWFGEFHLPNLVGANQKVRSVYSDIPTWMRDAERRVLSIAGQ